MNSPRDAPLAHHEGPLVPRSHGEVTDSSFASKAKQHSLFVTYHVFCVSGGDGWPTDEMPPGGNGLVHPFPGGAYIFTGIHTGPVTVTFRQFNEAPTEFDPNPWD